jgi:hypothetical protein
MVETPTITINMDAKCDECRKPGRCGNGLCLTCMNKAMSGKPMKSAAGAIVAQRFHELRQKFRGNP